MSVHSGSRHSRRWFSRLATGTLGFVSTCSLNVPGVRAQTQQDNPAGGPVDQVRIRRGGVGLRAFDPDQAFNGYTLISSTITNGKVILIDMTGAIAHTWTMPYAGWGYITNRGTLFFNGSIPNPAYPGRTGQAGVALESDWAGNILFEVRNPNHHHDGIRLRNGNILLVCYDVVPEDLTAQVQGGIAGTEHAWGMDGDYLQEVTTSGQVVWEWRVWEHLDPVEDGIPWSMDSRREWTTCNGIAEWPNDDITLSFRNISKVITLSRQTGQVLWKLGLPLVSGQHNPTPLASGNLLVFDNGPHRLPDPEHDPDGIGNASFPYSRVLELAVPNGDIVWKYQEPRVSDFFSPRIGGAQRLPNGNTLINEGWFGRLFEVTPGGQVVWEYVNPSFDPAAAIGNAVFRAYRYSTDEIDRASAGRSPSKS
jgi:hypothetical protein